MRFHRPVEVLKGRVTKQPVLLPLARVAVLVMEIMANLWEFGGKVHRGNKKKTKQKVSFEKFGGKLLNFKVMLSLPRIFCSRNFQLVRDCTRQ